MSVGERLRRGRLDARKSVEQVATETKIQLWILEAIERDDFSRVPGGVFIRGYLTAIACAVGVPPSEVLAAYLPEVPPPPAPVPVPAPPPDVTDRPAARLWQYVVIAAVVVGAAILWRDMTRTDSEVATALAPPPSATTPSRTPASSPAPADPRSLESGATATTGATSPTAPEKPPAADASTTTTAPFVLQLHANDEVWIEASADGERKAYQLLEQGQELRVEGQKEVRLLVGDAAAVSYTINNRPGRPLGGAGVVRELVMSPDTIQSLIRTDSHQSPVRTDTHQSPVQTDIHQSPSPVQTGTPATDH
jgi:cytoskeleton protein RodZ